MLLIVPYILFRDETISVKLLVLSVCVRFGAQLGLTLCNPMDCIAYQAPPSMGFSRQENWSGQLKSGNIRYMHETSVEENDPF